MIIFIEHGRLGNQLFQYVGLKIKAPDQKLIIIGCKELRKTFANTEALYINDVVFGRRHLLLGRIISLLAKMRILGTVTEDLASQVYKNIFRDGLLPGVYVTKETYFQHKDIVDANKWVPVLSQNILQQAQCWWQHKGLNNANVSPVFVHVRRGDYLNWRLKHNSREYPVSLDLSWYKRAMTDMQNMIKNPVFILMGDDQRYLHENFRESESIIISDNELGVDLAIMSYCVGGIMSASTFAWWGGFMAKHNEQSTAPKIFIAPKYWLGHNLKRWYPEHFVTDWITYVEY